MQILKCNSLLSMDLRLEPPKTFIEVISAEEGEFAFYSPLADAKCEGEEKARGEQDRTFKSLLGLIKSFDSNTDNEAYLDALGASLSGQNDLVNRLLKKRKNPALIPAIARVIHGLKKDRREVIAQFTGDIPTETADLLLIGEPFAPLPPGYGMTVAIQRSTRAGASRGTPLEDLGLVPDFVQPLTKLDLLESNEDLIRFVCGLLSACPRFHVEFDVLGTTKPENRDCLAVHVKSQNVERIECRVDGVVQLVRRVVDGEIVVEVPLDNTFPERFELQGFNKVRGESAYELKAARKRALTSAQRRPFRGDLAAGAGS